MASRFYQRCPCRCKCLAYIYNNGCDHYPSCANVHRYGWKAYCLRERVVQCKRQYTRSHSHFWLHLSQSLGCPKCGCSCRLWCAGCRSPPFNHEFNRHGHNHYYQDDHYYRYYQNYQHYLYFNVNRAWPKVIIIYFFENCHGRINFLWRGLLERTLLHWDMFCKLQIFYFLVPRIIY